MTPPHVKNKTESEVPVENCPCFFLHFSSPSPFLFCSLLPDGTLVESELLAFQDVAVGTAALARPRRDNGVQTTGLELPLEGGLDLAGGLDALGLLLLDGLALLLLLDGLAGLLLPPAAEGGTVVGLVPLSEGRSVNLHDGRLCEGVGAHELVVRRVVGDGDDTGLLGYALGAPGEVARVETQSAELAVAAAGANEMHALGSDTGVGGLTALLECPVVIPCLVRTW